MTFTPRRALGRTGFLASRLGIGDLADRGVPLARCVALLQRALDMGCNVIDTAPNYADGYSEEAVGLALRGRRDSAFLIDKIDDLRAPVAGQLDGSLRRLGHDHVDLLVCHACSTPQDQDRLQAPGGLGDQLAREVQRGRARFRGISSHHPDVLRAAIEAGLCDVVLFPLGPFVDARYEREILPLARARGVGTVCFKTFGAGMLVGSAAGYERPTGARPALAVEQCVRYTLTLDPDVALLGLSTADEQDAAWAAARAFAPFAAAELAAVRNLAAAAMAGKGPVWWNPPA